MNAWLIVHGVVNQLVCTMIQLLFLFQYFAILASLFCSRPTFLRHFTCFQGCGNFCLIMTLKETPTIAINHLFFPSWINLSLLAFLGEKRRCEFSTSNDKNGQNPEFLYILWSKHKLYCVSVPIHHASTATGVCRLAALYYQSAYVERIKHMSQPSASTSSNQGTALYKNQRIL